MVVLITNRALALRPRQAGTDGHGDRVATGFGPPGNAYPGLAVINADTPLGTPGGRTWRLACDPRLWPVAQQDMILDPDSGQQWQVTSAQLHTSPVAPWLNWIAVEAREYDSGTRA